MIIELLDINDEVVTMVDTNEPEYEFKHFKQMLPNIVGWRQHQWQEPTKSFEQVQTETIQKFGAEFASRRDATTWAIQADGSVYGYERKTEDVTNFMAAMKRAELGLDTGFNVYLNNADDQKQFLPHTAKMFHDALEQSAQEQITAYQRYEAIKKQIIDECDTIDELNAITW